MKGLANMIARSREDTARVLEAYAQRFTDIMTHIGDRARFQGDDASHARQLVSAIKVSLDLDIKEMERRRDCMSHWEAAYLLPALRESRANIQIRVNTTPGRQWGDNLYAARIDITHMLHGLNEPAK